MTVNYLCLVCNRAVAKTTKQPNVIHVIGGLILLKTIEKSTHIQNSTRIIHHGIIYPVFNKKCYFDLCELNSYKNLHSMQKGVKLPLKN